MPQNVPLFAYSDAALAVRQFVFDFWAEQRRGPTLRDVHDALQLSRREILDAYKQMQLGVLFTVDESTYNGNLLKAPPFCSFPSQVETHVDGVFHSFAGCACEGLAVSNMPHFKGKEVR